ncbi:aminoglycoside 3-N-acetyltransferase [Micromonospora matsumotoense]|uniref:Aminoglycoside N(3)-acetyltransferase n=1 Tax=Micromonospora matsumotoense TaxID=121616 RepID=A0A1C5ATP5_9ACTN|nr:aminoglycoside 3-N-acetyltransferase [Micromonospora matsumotoense]
MSGPSALAADLRALGLPAGATVLVHCALSRVRPVPGVPATLLAALRDALGDDGTVVVPTQTAGNSVTSPAFRAATVGLTPARAAAVEAAIEPFDPARSPAQGRGAFAEHVRRQADARRSAHPQTSFAALGPTATTLTVRHDLDCHLGDRSPLGALYAADALVLLLGVDWSVCTAFHLAEYRCRRPAPRRAYRCYVRGRAGAPRLPCPAPGRQRLPADRRGRGGARVGPLRSGGVRREPLCPAAARRRRRPGMDG